MRAKIARGDEQYLRFDCPGCQHPHVVPVTGPRAWRWDGSLEAPTLQPSILVTYAGADVGQAGAPPPRCHSFVTSGKIQFLGDCDHELAGATVDLPELE